jgi:hypothetical protein
VITPFGLRHIQLVRSLQENSTVLDFEHALLDPEAPLWTALRGYFLKSRAGPFTYVLQAPDHGKKLHGFVQARARKPGTVWNVTRIAPALDGSGDAATTWYRLLLHLCIAAGERHVQRLLARLAQGGNAEDIFRQASFSVYCHERLFRRPPPDGNAKASSDMQPLGPEHSLDVQGLFSESTPRLVQLAEGVEDVGTRSQPPDIPSSDTQCCYGLIGPRGRMLGFLRILVGPLGSWVRLMMLKEAHDWADEMLDHALCVLSDHPPRPVYCSVREYQGGLQTPLEERGFSLADAHSLLVKHTTVRVSESSRKLVTSLEKRAGVVPTASRSEAEMELH